MDLSNLCTFIIIIITAEHANRSSLPQIILYNEHICLYWLKLACTQVYILMCRLMFKIIPLSRQHFPQFPPLLRRITPYTLIKHYMTIFLTYAAAAAAAACLPVVRWSGMMSLYLTSLPIQNTRRSHCIFSTLRRRTLLLILRINRSKICVFLVARIQTTRISGDGYGAYVKVQTRRHIQ